MNTKLLAVVLAIFSIQCSFAANVTSGSTVGTNAVTTGACTGTTSGFSYTNCAFCDTAAASTFCTACNVGYQLIGTTGNPTTCATSCASGSGCLYCAGSTAPKAAAAAADSTGASTSLCQIENQPVPTSITQAQAYCRNTTTTTAGVTTTQYYTPGTISAAYQFNCWACSITQCMDCRLASGQPTSSASANQCRQCINGYYLDSNTTTGSITTGTACTACSSIPTIGTVSTTSGTFVIGTCNQCVNKNQCINATCTKTSYSSSGTASTDSTSYTFDVSKQQCVSKSSAVRLSFALVGVVVIAVIAMF